MNKKSQTGKRTSLRVMQFAFSTLGPLLPGLFGRLAYDLWFTTRRFKRPAAEDEAARVANRSLISVNGVEVTVWSWGEGKPVLFMHGWCGRGTQAVHFKDCLIASGFKVVSYDGPAHGETPGKQTSMLELAEVTLALDQQFGPFHSTITHSFGGMVLAYAITKGFNTRSAVCICPAANIDTILGGFQRSLNLPDSVLAAMKHRLYTEYGNELDNRVSMLANVRALSIPALIVHDEFDRDVPWEDGRAVADTWPGAEFMLTRGLGHRRILRDPAVIASVSEFVRKR